MVASDSGGAARDPVRPVRVGLAGAGFAAGLHLRAYRTCGNPAAEVVGIVGGGIERARRVADEYGVPAAYDDYRRLLDRADVDVIDLCVPNNLHHEMALNALQAGKHLIVEKPLTGYFGGPEAADPVGKTPRSVMLREALRSASRHTGRGQPGRCAVALCGELRLCAVH